MIDSIKLIIALAILAMFSSPGFGHDAFKEPLEKRYKLKTVSCKTCHPNNKDRSIHNKFGQMFLPLFKGKDLTKKFNEAEAVSKEAKEAYEKIMADEFLKALVEVEKKQLTIKDMIEAGLLNGTRLDVPKTKK